MPHKMIMSRYKNKAMVGTWCTGKRNSPKVNPRKLLPDPFQSPHFLGGNWQLGTQFEPQFRRSNFNLARSLQCVGISVEPLIKEDRVITLDGHILLIANSVPPKRTHFRRWAQRQTLSFSVSGIIHVTLEFIVL